MNKFYFGFFLLLLTCGVAAAAETIRMNVTPEHLTVGDSAVLHLALPMDTGTLRTPELPKVEGIRWNNQISRSQSIRIINGKRTAEMTLGIGFTVLKDGTFTIPGLKFSAANGELTGNSVTFTVSKAPEIKNEEDAAEQIAFAQMEIAGRKNRTCYAGEEITLAVSIYVRSPYGGSLRDFSLLFMPETAAETAGEVFSYPGAQRVIGGKNFSVSRFGQTIRLTEPGKLSVHASIPLVITENSGFFQTPVAQKTLNAALEDIVVEKRPPLPAGTVFSGLTGYGWEADFSLSPPPYRSGEPVTLKMNLTGYGNTALFSFPELKTNDLFRAYPAEVRRKKEQISVSQTLIPLQTGELPVKSAVTVFDTESGTYKTFQLDQKISVEKGSAEQAVIPPVFVTEPIPETAEIPEREPEILYLRTDGLTDGVRIPLWKNAVIPGLSLIAAGLFCLIVCGIAAVRRRNCGNDPEWARRLAAKSGKKHLMRQIEHAFGQDGLNTESAAALSEYFSALRGLPPGTSLAGTVDKIDDPELAEMVGDIAGNLWTPAGFGRHFDEAYKKRFLRALRRFSLIAAGFFSCSLGAAEPGKDAYDNGNFDQALTEYRQMLKKEAPSAAVLYNMGNCYWQKGDYPEALVKYEQAHNLDPRNTACRINLDRVRNKLGLQVKSRLSSPKDFVPLLRDMMRLDEWLIAGAAGLMLCLAGTGLGFLYGRRILIGMYAAGILLILLCGAAVLMPDPDAELAVVVTDSAPVYTLPSLRSGKIETKLRAGKEITVEEQRQDWFRVRLDGVADGWMKAADIRKYQL